MGIYIKGMEMPINEPLIVKINPDGSVSTTWKNDYKKYEAVPVPSHGDLVERDALIKTIRTERNRIAKAYGDDDDFVRSLDKYALSMAVCAPTIIEAESEGKDND